MAMVIDNEYEIGDIVYLKTDIEQVGRMVYAFKVYKNDVLYELTCGTSVSTHYGFEISKEINTELKLA